MNHRMRFLHGAMICIVAILVPLTIAAGVYFRTIDYKDDHVTSTLMQPDPYGTLLSKNLPMFGNLPIRANVRSDSLNNLQLEIIVDKPLGEPKLAMFWSPSRETHVGMEKWKYIGPIYGVGLHRYALPAEASDRNSGFVIASVLNGQEAGRGILPRLNLSAPTGNSQTDDGGFGDEFGL